MTIEFFNTEPSVREKLNKYRKEQLQVNRDKITIVPKIMSVLKKKVAPENGKRTRSSSENSDVESRPKKKMSKFDSLKPISTFLENLFVKQGLAQQKADLIVFDITERFVTAGFGWDKILQYHSKVI